MALSEHGHILNACQFFKAMNEAQVEFIVMEAFARFSCEIELLPTNEPWHFSLVR